jgi:membrane protein implicated in regulation of membrane protease activity
VPAWLVWLIVAGVLGVAEVLSLTLVLGMLAVAAVAGAGVAAVGGPAALQVVVAAVIAVLLLGVVRPVARRHRGMPPSIRTGADALVGRQALVLEPVDRNGGRVKIGGEIWTARAYDEAQVIPAGHTVDVLRIEGATALVHALELP